MELMSGVLCRNGESEGQAESFVEGVGVFEVEMGCLWIWRYLMLLVKTGRGENLKQGWRSRIEHFSLPSGVGYLMAQAEADFSPTEQNQPTLSFGASELNP